MNKKMNILIFSKDRACQLDYMLKSMRINFHEYNSHKINIIYMYKNDEHARGYNKLKEYFPEINFICQNTTTESFRSLVISNILPDNEYTVFFVDDNMFKMPFSIEDKEFKILDTRNDVACLSLRMNHGMTHCHPARLTYTHTPALDNNIWKWRGEQGDWGYPMSVDGHVFRTPEIINTIHRFDFDTPTNFENNMSMHALPQEFMVCYEKSIVFNNPLNRVHNRSNTPHANISEDMLLGEYLAGKRIYLNCNINTIIFPSPHYDVPIGLS